jgi:zinc D-Ala-D-Ala dipeptidase
MNHSKIQKNCRTTFVVILVLASTFCGCKEGPPKEAGTFRSPDLVELTTLDSTIHLDIRYATTHNFTGQAVYSQPKAILQRPAAEVLVRVHQKLRAQGWGLLILDGYRPWSVTKLFWEKATEQQRKDGFVANPAKGSRHNRGCAVDLTLYSLATGTEVQMPSVYDEFTERASPGYSGGAEESRKLRDLLRTSMEAEGFTVEKSEWWHFDYQDWASYPLLDVPFEKLQP